MQAIHKRARTLAFTYTDVVGLERGIVQPELPPVLFPVGRGRSMRGLYDFFEANIFRCPTQFAADFFPSWRLAPSGNDRRANRERFLIFLEFELSCCNHPSTDVYSKNWNLPWTTDSHPILILV
jgi:hypothetical protein